ncbi:TetR/AcrR family transcriptional regulator [Natronobacterium gregoryi]|uniref:Transcriptional regulator n=2 Tax=Natronobacterium gregoryi TaxID=44930 RepID=L0AHE3_NATGS|nr:TetR/AcrR family transcriptional regulator [Natronobacterium gregoryi]AFZ72490.1 transcriptional regulator [Natronobacterium gregoryi SP2]ELY74362.1 TetR family transcriptional regulator [Natronobacterium gregoryi SP2]PLK21461.1 TetR/AcrR family transcriptional regulator [Natronobacterium gregoryi SP2]SFI77290.1 transcriptional regulator, TetR family [Natronobacterium gregoryi]
MADTPGAGWVSTSTDEFDETTEEIMRAVYRALSKNGYPETTMAEIASEFEKSKGLLYYHYDSKEAILNDFFTYLCQRLQSSLIEESYEDPYERLLAVVDRILPAAIDDEQLEFRQALFEVRSQAPHNRSYYEQIRRSDRIILETLTETIQQGVETGRFADVDPERRAELLFSTLYGIMERGAALGDRDLVERNREMVRVRLERTLLA